MHEIMCYSSLMLEGLKQVAEPQRHTEQPEEALQHHLLKER